MEPKFNKGDRVRVINDNSLFGVPVGATEFVNDDVTIAPWVKFDLNEQNYTKNGTAISVYDLEHE